MKAHTMCIENLRAVEMQDTRLYVKLGLRFGV